MENVNTAPPSFTKKAAAAIAFCGNLHPHDIHVGSTSKATPSNPSHLRAVSQSRLASR